MSKFNPISDPNECYFCGIRKDPTKKTKFRSVVEKHHIKEKNEGGSNEALNLIYVCSNHHSMVHEKKIKIDGWYFSTCNWLLHWYDESGKEHWGKK
jgi:hypothetical protein